MGCHVLRGTGVISTFLEPKFDGFAVGRCMIFDSAGKAKLRLTGFTGNTARFRFLKCINYTHAMRVCTETKTRVCLVRKKLSSSQKRNTKIILKKETHTSTISFRMCFRYFEAARRSPRTARIKSSAILTLQAASIHSIIGACELEIRTSKNACQHSRQNKCPQLIP